MIIQTEIPSHNGWYWVSNDEHDESSWMMAYLDVESDATFLTTFFPELAVAAGIKKPFTRWKYCPDRPWHHWYDGEGGSWVGPDVWVGPIKLQGCFVKSPRLDSGESERTDAAEAREDREQQ